MMAASGLDDQPLLLLFGNEPHFWPSIRRCFSQYHIQPLRPFLISRRQKNTWRRLVAEGRDIAVASQENRGFNQALILSRELDLPLKRLERSILNCLAPELPGTESWCLTDWPDDLEPLDSETSRVKRRVAENLLNLSRRLKIFFDSSPAYHNSLFSRILIIGSSSDLETELELIRLAIRENPEAEVYYQKYPGRLPYRSALLKELNRQRPSRILAPHQLPPEVDRVYTVNSPAALGLILAGLKVTVTGHPPYAGRGLTDDRSSTIKKTTLTVADLFYCLCLRSTVYEVSPLDPVRGCLTALMSLSAAQCHHRLEWERIKLRKVDQLLLRQAPGIIKKSQMADNGLKQLAANISTILEPDKSLDVNLTCAPPAGWRGALASAETTLKSLAEVKPADQADRYSPARLKLLKKLLALAAVCFKRQRLERVLEFSRRLLPRAHIAPETLWLIIEATRRRFAFDEALALSWPAGRWFPKWRKGLFFFSASQDALLTGRPEDSLRLMAYCCAKYKRSAEIPFPGPENKWNDIYGLLPWQKAMSSLQLARRGRQGLGTIKSLLYAEDFEKGLKLKYPDKSGYLLLKSKILRLTGDYAQARNLLERLLSISPKAEMAEVYHEALALSLNFNDDWSARLWEEAEAKNINLNAFLAWQTLCGLGRLQEAFNRHVQAPYFNQLQVHLGPKWSANPPAEKPFKQILVLSECFLGDELRFSRLYPRLAQAIPAEKIIFSCDPRAYELLRRSFPRLRFQPIEKSISLHFIKNLANFNQLPSVDCARYLNNAGWELAMSSDKVTTVMHTLAATLTDYSNLEDLPDLKPDPAKKAAFRAIIESKTASNVLIAGLSWRSNLVRHDRNRTVFNLTQLAPLLGMDGIQWVNCQYDGCTEEEQDYLDRHFPGRVLNLAQVDQYNNVDDAAALYDALDVMVSGPTYCADLAGCLGRKTLILATSPALMVWARPGTNRHAFMSQVELYPGEPNGSKIIVAQSLMRRIDQLKIKAKRSS